MQTFISEISKKEFPISERVLGNSIRKSLLNYIISQYPDFSLESCLTLSELNNFREMYISTYLTKQLGELSESEKTVLDSIVQRSMLSNIVDMEGKENINFGQKIADKVADFGGSWTFIISFLMFIVLWITLNILILKDKSYDPFPFILLNLILSCIAALQAPVIMMSQNRQEEKDRIRAKNDYMINLKSEIEIRALHEKIDHLILHQQQELFEIQKIQIEMMNDIMNQIKMK
jgi:uncharacterized membrane protein